MAWLARHLRAHPLDGVGIDDQGNPHKIHLTEGYLDWRILQSGQAFIADTEVAAAAEALRHGDSARCCDWPPRTTSRSHSPRATTRPSSRPATTTPASAPTSPGSGTSRHRSRCAASSTRRSSTLPADTFAPFSVDGWLAPYPVGIGSTECIRWPKPTHDRIKAVPARATFPQTPVLVLAGSLDLVVPSGDARLVADEFPNSRFVLVHGSGHTTTLDTHASCGQALAVHFLKTHRPGDTSCAAGRPDFTFPAVQAFPASIGGEREARSMPGDGSTARDRRAISSAFDAIRDTLWHQYVYGGFPEADGPGLSGGGFHIAYDDVNHFVTLQAYGLAFTHDLRLTGTITQDANDVLDARIEVRGAVRGHLHLRGIWLDPRATLIHIHGTLNGRTIVAAEPTN